MNAVIRVITWLLVAALLAAGFGFLYLRTRDLDAPKRHAVHSLLSELKDVDVAIDGEVLRSRTGLNKDYDSIARFQTRLGSIQAALSAQSAETSDFAVRDANKRLSEALSEKIDLLDQFKAQNAILLNSVRFIPAAAGGVTSQARDAAETSPAVKVQMTALGDSAEQLFLETLKLETNSDADNVKRVRQLLSPLVERRSDYPPAVAEPVEVFANHLLAILAQKEREDVLFSQMAKLSVAKNVDALASAFDTAFGRATAKVDQYRYLLYGYGALVVALFAFFFGRRGRKAAAVPA
jgi:two-component system NtrC family sensor kinase